MKNISLTIRCPSCAGALLPVVLACPTCGIRVEGAFRQNEFAELGEEDLHFLRIFVHCEGRIREMESALGVSYPTIKSRLAALKEKLTEATTEAPEVREAAEGSSRLEILEQLEAGKINFVEAKALLRRRETTGEKP